ncbi:hypothetical protein [Spirillospora sp. NPDC048819]|uniref:hypothetical protein n=1 Tax=Spirillospora sp. NPDC048819 TaxID=3155268 RepID=UPI0033F88B76
MNTSTRTVTPPGSATAPASPVWTLGAAAALAAVLAVLHTFVQATPTIDALMAGDTPAESQQGLRMMWHGMSAIAWTCPVVLLLLRQAPAAAARPVLGFVAVLNGSQAVFYAAAALVLLWADGSFGSLSLLPWALHAPVAVLAWLARPSRPERQTPPPARRRGRLVLLWSTTVLAAVMAAFHLIQGTFMSWPAEVLASDTTSPAKPALYVMWLFSCVVFLSVPVAVVWSLRAPAAAGRFVVRYAAVLVAALMVSWFVEVTFVSGDDLQPSGWVVLGLLATLTALSAPPRNRSNT